MKLDPQAGPRTTGWKRFDPADTTSLAILGKSVTGADSGDHVTADRSCANWNTVLPIFPQVLSALSMFATFITYRVYRSSRAVVVGLVDLPVLFVLDTCYPQKPVSAR